MKKFAALALTLVFAVVAMSFAHAQTPGKDVKKNIVKTEKKEKENKEDKKLKPGNELKTATKKETIKK